MAVIKSALELAMDRANNIKVDPIEVKRKALEQKGKEAASKYLNDIKYDFKEWFKDITNDDKNATLNGIIWVFIKNITLPVTTADVDKLLRIKEGMIIVSSKLDEIEQIFTQLTLLFQQYIENSKTMFEQSKTEFAPKLQQKAMQLAQQTGQMVPIEPETDRDFIAFHREKQEQLDAHFKALIKQTTDTIENII